MYKIIHYKVIINSSIMFDSLIFVGINQHFLYNMNYDEVVEKFKIMIPLNQRLELYEYI